MTDDITVAVSELLGTTREWFDGQAPSAPCLPCGGKGWVTDTLSVWRTAVECWDCRGTGRT